MTSQVWSISTGDLVQSMRGHSGAVTGVQFLDRDTAARLASADTEEEVRLVSAGSDCSVRVWGVAGGDGCGAGRYTALLVLSSCGREMFTCHRTGSCVPMAARWRQ